jgi:hypothetical protein
MVTMTERKPDRLALQLAPLLAQYLASLERSRQAIATYAERIAAKADTTPPPD